MLIFKLRRKRPNAPLFRFQQAFQIVFDLRPDTMDFNWTNTDETFHEDAIYYVRLRQTGLVRDRIAMAWSSPIWVKRQ